MPEKTRYAQVGMGSRSSMYYEALATTYREFADLVALCDSNPGRLAFRIRCLGELGHDAVPTYAADQFEQMIAVGRTLVPAGWPRGRRPPALREEANRSPGAGRGSVPGALPSAIQLPSAPPSADASDGENGDAIRYTIMRVCALRLFPARGSMPSSWWGNCPRLIGLSSAGFGKRKPRNR